MILMDCLTTGFKSSPDNEKALQRLDILDSVCTHRMIGLLTVNRRVERLGSSLG